MIQESKESKTVKSTRPQIQGFSFFKLICTGNPSSLTNGYIISL